MFTTLGSFLDQVVRQSPALLSQNWSTVVWAAIAFVVLRRFARLGSYH
jgi:hypothetical protein